MQAVLDGINTTRGYATKLLSLGGSFLPGLGTAASIKGHYDTYKQGKDANELESFKLTQILNQANPDSFQSRISTMVLEPNEKDTIIKAIIPKASKCLITIKLKNPRNSRIVTISKTI